MHAVTAERRIPLLFSAFYQFCGQLSHTYPVWTLINSPELIQWVKHLQLSLSLCFKHSHICMYLKLDSNLALTQSHAGKHSRMVKLQLCQSTYFFITRPSLDYLVSNCCPQVSHSTWMEVQKSVRGHDHCLLPGNSLPPFLLSSSLIIPAPLCSSCWMRW